MPRDDYNWIDDPFDETKKDKLAQAGLGKGARSAFLFGMLALALCVIVVFVLVLVGLATLVRGAYG